MTTVEAAQAWAEAKELKDKALGALRAAEEAYKSADLADREAWEALQALSGRVAGKLNVPEWAAPARPNGEYAFDDGFKR